MQRFWSTPLSHRVKIMSARTLEPMDPPTSWEWSHSRGHRAWARGSFTLTHGVGQLKPTATAWASRPSASLTPKAELQQEDTISQWWTPLPGFTEIVRSLHGDNLPRVVMGVPPELAEEQDSIWMVVSTMFSTWLFQDSVSGATYINMVTWSISLVGMGFTPLALDHSMSTLLGDINMVTCSISLVGMGFTPLALDHSMSTLLGEEDMDSN